jgi:exonuclease SbcC
LLQRLGATARQSIAAELSAGAELRALGNVNYDPDAHAAARNAVQTAEGAAARARQIDAYLAQRPEREQEIVAASDAVANLEASRGDLETQRADLAFDPALLERARAAETGCVTVERNARDRRAAAQAAHAEAVRTRDALARDQTRIQGLAERAERRGREADELDRMYREFNAFEQYVADRLTPQLADYTSELLGAITEGKYSQVEFTSNYGIEVFDGSDEKFPVEEFSGGERDVIALCARLALSRLIGSQAANPPGFMVLDEVFGSLDRERRAQVLETFGSLAGSAEAFSQLFIISHVDDVRSSPIFNEVWRVAEGPDGVSRLENLNVSGGFEDA